MHFASVDHLNVLFPDLSPTRKWSSIFSLGRKLVVNAIYLACIPPVCLKLGAQLRLCRVESQAQAPGSEVGVARIGQGSVPRLSPI